MVKLNENRQIIISSQFIHNLTKRHLYYGHSYACLLKYIISN